VSHLYALYGMVVDSDVDLHQDRPAPAGAAPDLVVRTAAEAALPPEPGGAPVLEFERGGARYVAHGEPDGGWRLRFADACDFVVSPDLARVEVHRAPGADPGIATILTLGALCAFVLYLRGAVVLHASAVEHDGAAIAFVGASGRGKSTTAALACSAGARLVTDDLLHVALPDDGTARAVLGATELRLRKGADTLLERFAGTRPETRVSVDGRQVLRLDDAAQGGRPLSAIVIPCPDREHDELAVDVLSPSAALFTLLTFPRLDGWAHPPVVRSVFEGLAELTRRVPVIALRIPWGPPFRPTLGAEILDAVGDALRSPDVAPAAHDERAEVVA
jgi:hypothetical protein